MFGKKIHLFSLFGFKVGLDITWILLAVLVTWSLATGLFPQFFEGYAQSTYWWMGATGALGLFVSIVFHEFCHSLVARQFGMPMKGITLFIFGGVAEMNEEPPSAKAEFFMAIAGPISSVILAGILYSMGVLGKRVAWPGPVVGVLSYLALLNVILAGFNMVPAFPLDGGRVLRSALWKAKGNLRWATRIASGFGSAFGMFLIVLGVISFIGGGFVGGIWYFLIGLFIREASQMSYQQVLMRRALGGEQVSRFMKEQPVTVPSSVPVDELVNDYFYKYHYKMFPVTNGHGPAGCVTTRQIKEVPKEQWSERTVGDIQESCSDENTISPHADAISALSRMKRTDKSRLLVVDGDRLVGVLTLKDMLKFLSMKVDLEED
jgi:Zn-dependent protease/CBS domain-containing protein